MAKDPLQMALSLRKCAVEDAKRGLASALSAEQTVAIAVSRATEAIRRESDAAMALSTSDASAEAYAAWLPRGLSEQERARLSLQQAENVTHQARATLTAARTAEATIEKLLEGRAGAARRLAERTEQATLDEMAHRRRDRVRRPLSQHDT